MKPVEDMSFEDIETERAAIRAERERLGLTNGTAVPPVEPPVPPDLREEIDAALPQVDVLGNIPEKSEEDKSKPWPHEHLSFAGMELDVRTPNQSALMAISMLQQLDGFGELQMEIFNTFLANHLSRTSLAEVIKEMTRPDSEMSLQGLVQALVNLRVNTE